MNKYIIFTILFFTSVLIYSHDNSDFDFYGFSYDKKYCAFEIYGIEDKSEVYSNIYIIDVEKNIYAHNPFIKKSEYSDSNNSLWDLRIKNLKKVLPILKKLGIYPHNKCTLVFSNIRINPKNNRQIFTILNDEFELILNEFPYNKDRKIFELLVIGNNIKKILQKDKELPINREYANGYKLMCGYYYYGAIAIIIEYEECGFEGNNKRQMVVTGILKTKNLEMQYD